MKTCAGLIFIMTPDSVQDQSVCKQEWTRALKYKKPITPLLLSADAEMPFRLGSRHYIDFSGDFEPALARLRKHVEWLKSPRGLLQSLNDRLADAKRDLLRAESAGRPHIEDDIRELNLEIEKLQRVIADPDATSRETRESISLGIERARQPQLPEPVASRAKFVNPPPLVAPTYFQDRFVETKLIADFLQNESQRLLTVVGRGGVGKTALTCRFLRALQNKRLPDDLGPCGVDGIVYLSSAGSRQVSFANIFSDLCRLLPPEKADALGQVYKTPQPVSGKMQALLEAFPSDRVILLLDNFEAHVEVETRSIKDAELCDALKALLLAAQHPVKVIITTRVAPENLKLVQPGRQARIDLDEGLASPYAENILREMDADGKVGLKSAPPSLLAEAQKRTRGYPRALEALYAILSADRDTDIKELLNDTRNLVPEDVVEVMVGEAFSRLDTFAQMIMQALAIYGCPVSPTAIDYLLEPFQEGVDSRRVLKRLFSMHFVRKEGDQYYLHPIDRSYALSRIEEGDESDRYAAEKPVYTQYALWDRAADFFHELQKERAGWKSLDDLASHVNEFRLRCAGHDYETAASILIGIRSELLTWGHYQQFIDWYGELDVAAVDRWTQGECLIALGLAHGRLGNSKKAFEINERGLELSRDFGLGPEELNHFYLNITADYHRLGKHAVVLERMTKSLELARERNERHAEAFCLSYISFSRRDLGQYYEALEAQREAVSIYRDLGVKEDIEGEVHNLASVLSSLGRISEAIDHYRESLELAEETRNTLWKANHLASLGARYRDLGRTADAEQAIRQALVLHEQIGVRGNVGDDYIELGLVFLDKGQEVAALEHALKGIDLLKDMDTPLMSVHLVLALIHLRSRNISAACKAIEAAGKFDEPLNSPLRHLLSGAIALHENNQADAVIAFKTAIDETTNLLSLCDANHDALDTRSLATCGLAACGEHINLDQAIRDYKAGRATTSNAVGIAKRFERLFTDIESKDSSRSLRPMRLLLPS